MKQIDRKKAIQLLKEEGLHAYNGLNILKYHNNSKAYVFSYKPTLEMIVIDGYWVTLINTSLKKVVNCLKDLGYKEFGVNGGLEKYYKEACCEKYKIDWFEKCYVYSYKGEDLKYSIPNGYYADILKKEDAKILYKYYTYKEDTPIDEIIENIVNRDSVVIKKANGELVSWVTVHPDGTMGIMYTKKEFRRLYLGQITSKILINKLIDKGEIPYVHIVDGNKASVGLAEKLGMEYMFDIVWFGIAI